MSNNAFSRGLTLVEIDGFDTSTTLLSTITSGSGSEGSWTELIASTIADADTLYVYTYLSSGGGAVDDILIDIGVGAAASEQTIVENIPYSGRVYSSGGLIEVQSYPVSIPAGTRVSARAIADAAIVMGIGIALYKGGEKSSSFSGAKAIGITANYGGTPVDSGAAANTKGSWTELIASTAETIRGFWIHMGLLENLTVGVLTGDMIDIGIGGAGSETVIVSNHFVIVNANEYSFQSTFFDIEIPAGTRVSARRQCSDTDATDRIRSIALVGLI